MSAKSEFENVQSRIQSLLLRTPRDQRTGAWGDFYFAQPNTSESHVAGYQRKFDAFKAEGVGGEYLPAIETLVRELVRLAGIHRAEKAAPKVKRQVSADSGRYSYPTEPSFKVGGPQDIVAGDYLLVSYGPHGTQLVFVASSIPTRKTLSIRRLFNRGTRGAQWRISTLSREDQRILGRSNRVPQDPLP